MSLNFLVPKTRRDFTAAKEYWLHMQSCDDSELPNLQLQKIQGVWRDAVQDIPYYGRLVAEGLAPTKIASWEDFFRIPELTREILQDHKDEFVRKSGPPDLWRMTGGSTGNPIKFGVWNSEDGIIRMLKLVLWHRVGYLPSDRLFLIWGHSHLLGTGWRRYWNHFLRKGKDAVLGYKRVDAYALSPQLCKEYSLNLLKFRPAGLIGYSAVLDYFIRSLPEKWDQFRSLNLKFVMPCAEPAPKEDSFELLEKVFGCPVIQEFGGVDFGHVGMKLGDEPFRIFGDYNFVETAEEDAQAMVTSLYTRYLPLIRYRQGDVLGGVRKLENKHVAIFESLKGRVNDMVSLSDGTSVHSVAVFHCAHQEASVLNIQMVLYDHEIRILLVTREGYSSDTEFRIRQRLSQISPTLGKAKIEAVDDLITTRAGKRRWFVDLRSNSQS